MMHRKAIPIIVFLFCTYSMYAQLDILRLDEDEKITDIIILKQKNPQHYKKIIIEKYSNWYTPNFLPYTKDLNTRREILKYLYINDSTYSSKDRIKDRWWSPFTYSFNCYYRIRNYNLINYMDSDRESFYENYIYRDSKAHHYRTKDSAGYKVTRIGNYEYGTGENGPLLDSSITYRRDKLDEQKRLVERTELYYRVEDSGYDKLETWQYTDGMVKHIMYRLYGSNKALVSVDYTRVTWNADSTLKTTKYVKIHHRLDTAYTNVSVTLKNYVNNPDWVGSDKYEKLDTSAERIKIGKQWNTDTLTERIYFTYNKDKYITRLRRVLFDSWFKLREEDEDMDVKYKKE